MRFPRLLASALLLAAPLAHAQPALVDFAAPVPQALAVAPGGAEPLNPTLAALRADPNVSDLRVGRADPQAVVSARAFRLDPTAGPGDTIAVSSLAVIPSGGGEVVFLLGEGADLAVDGSDVLGHVSDDGTIWRLRPLGGGLTAVFRYDESKLRRHPPGWNPGALPGGLPAEDAGPLGDRPAAAPDQSTGPAVVDVFVGYTARAATRMGSNPGLFVERAVARANEHFGNSRIADAVRLRLVGASLVSLAETGDIVDALEGLRLPTDGIADGVHATRDRLGADLVHLLIDGTTPSGDGAVTCGVAYTAYRSAAHAFGVTAVQCEPGSRGGSTFTHEIGHNFGADHDPANFSPPGTFPYARGFCDPNTGWATTMAYIGINNPCTRGIAYFSSPTVRHNGNSTGHAGADNARVLRETAAIVAAHREAASPVTQAVTLPYVLPAGRGDGSHSLLRLANLGDAPLAIAIRAFDDTGTAFGPVTATLGARTATPITSVKLESEGHPALDRTLGNGTGAWRLELTAPGAFEASALFRTADGFMVPLHAVAAADPGAASGHVYRVPTANPASNTRKESSLRLANRAAQAAAVRITGFDDVGRASGEVSLSIPARAAFNLTVRELEAGRADTGGPGLTGSLGDGTGKWRLSVASDQPLAVVSLLKTATGSGSYLANLSDPGPSLPAVEVSTPPPPPPPPPPGDDHGDTRATATVVRAPSTTAGRLEEAGDVDYFRFELPRAGRLVVQTTGGTDTIGRLYRGSQLVRTNDDGGSGLNFRITEQAASAGTWYVAVSGYQSRTGAYSLGVEFSGGTTPPAHRYGAIASGIIRCVDGFDTDDFVASISVNHASQAAARSSVLDACNRRIAQFPTSNRCSIRVVFGTSFTHGCGALAYGETSTHCLVQAGTGVSPSRAEADALARCRRDGGRCSLLRTGDGGRRFSTCVSSASSTQGAESGAAKPPGSASRHSISKQPQAAILARPPAR